MFHRRQVICIFCSLLLNGISASPEEVGMSIQAIKGGDTVSSIKRYPYLVSLQINGQQYCGGTIINTQYVLTAKHCCVLQLTNVLAGSLTLAPKEPAAQEFKIVSKESNPTPDVDLCVIKLDRPIQANDFVKPIGFKCKDQRLWGPNHLGQAESGQGEVAGWGLTEEHQVSNELKWAVVRLRHDKVCIDQLGPCRMSGALVKYNGHTMYCAGGDYMDTCAGDSGGPLMYVVDGEHLLLGVTSCGNCAVPNLPGIYAWTYYAQEWIASKSELTCT